MFSFYRHFGDRAGVIQKGRAPDRIAGIVDEAGLAAIEHPEDPGPLARVTMGGYRTAVADSSNMAVFVVGWVSGKLS